MVDTMTRLRVLNKMIRDREKVFPKVRFCLRRPGFSLVELLVVVTISCAIMTFSAISISNAALEKGSDVSVIRETERFERWLNRLFFRACIERRSFNFVSMPCSTPGRYIQIRWNDTNQKETYDTKENCFFTVRGGIVKNSTYSPQWQTVSPAFTLKAVRTRKDTQTVKFIRVSVYSKVSVTDDPPSY